MIKHSNHQPNPPKLFSALYSMLPNARTSLEAAAFTPKEAAWILIACFLGGALGIQLLSRVLHSYMSPHIVSCENPHDEEQGTSPMPKEDDDAHEHQPPHHHPPTAPRPQGPRTSSLPGHMLQRPLSGGRRLGGRRSSYFGSRAAVLSDGEALTPGRAVSRPQTLASRPTLRARLTTGFAQMVRGPEAAGCEGTCFGYSEGYRTAARRESGAGAGARPGVRKSLMVQGGGLVTEGTPLLGCVDEGDAYLPPPPSLPTTDSRHWQHHHDDAASAPAPPTAPNNPSPPHHHHPPQNPFLALSLQTSLAIALHKLPEGFITYATNHANPHLGTSIFLALAIHNITEGFALALPLYLTLHSRPKTLIISFILGGLTQPLGAGVAAVWFALAGQGEWAPREGVYGGMFAVTAGVMASVGLQLFGEGLDLGGASRGLCLGGAFAGMAVMGVSGALTA
ncbi:hypothetical protein LTR08_006611 [Meristemomyces frigidus]|nr:hypothetical protein LTR08_006611 [Meristemomyces frigidus]